MQLNQLLVMGHEAPVGDAFFRYYWLLAPEEHPYGVREIPGFSEKWFQDNEMISSLEHLKWGLYRLYVDALLYFGNVRTAFQKLRDLSMSEICALFKSERYDTAAIKRRGPALPLKAIPKDNRYLISEMACKSYGDLGQTSDLRKALVESLPSATLPPATKRLRSANCSPIECLQLFRHGNRTFIFSADAKCSRKGDLDSEDDLGVKYGSKRQSSMMLEKQRSTIPGATACSYVQ